jgi:hypothetical protein
MGYKYSTLYPSKFLRAGDLPHPVVAKIDRVELEKLAEGEDPKPVLYLAGQRRGLVLNKTNAAVIISLCGQDDTDAWIGRWIEVYAGETMFRGELVPCIRLRKPQQKPKAPVQPEPVTDAWEDDQIPDSWEDEPRR